MVKNCPAISHLFFADDSRLFCKASIAECQHVQDILTKCDKASSQCVNFSKSAMLFSPNVTLPLKSAINGVLGMKVVKNLGKYLGLPSHFSRSKSSDLNFLREIVHKVLAGWKYIFFSIGGKETLIKPVVQAIPTFVMSCPRLPKALCDDLMKMVAKFWWGSTNDSRKIHWKAWDKICLPKDKGGLGFRCIEGFNQALLAKQSWRMLCSPNSLVSRVFKGKYFPHTDILKASLGYRPSYIWSSVIWGRDLLLQGLRK